MSAVAAPKLYTFEEFCEVIEDGQKADLIDGEIILASPDSLNSNDIQWFLGELLRRFSRKHYPGRVYGSRIAFRLATRRGPEPDVAFVPEANADRLRPGYVDGAPDLAVEVVSEDSIQRDYIRKRAMYEQAGILEYWIINPLRREALFLRLREGEYEEVALDEGDIFRSEAVPKFWVRMSWLFQDPLPDPDTCLEQILASVTES